MERHVKGGQLLATNDDKGPGNFGSRLDFCLPAGPTDNWFLAIIGFSSSDAFAYNVAVDVEGPCLFEDEPNGICSLANEMLPDTVYSGLQTAAGVAESDWWVFTLDEAAFVTVSTDGWDDFAVDTFLELWGPTDAASCPGAFIAGDDDGGDGFLSLIGATKAVIRMTSVSGETLRVWRNSSRPDIPGMEMSLMTRSYSLFSSILLAPSSPVSAVSTP